MAPSMDAHRKPVPKRRLTAAQATKARLRIGIEKTGSIIPIIPPAIDGWTIRFVASTTIGISTIAPNRSNQGARLKNNHHNRIINAQTNPPNIA